MKAYLKDGLDVNSQDWDKLTALVAAASQGHLKVVKLLLDKVSAVPCDALRFQFLSGGSVKVESSQLFAWDGVTVVSGIYCCSGRCSKAGGWAGV